VRTATFLVVILASGLGSLSNAQFAPGPRGEVLRYGLCEQAADHMYLTDLTDSVPLRKGVGFGMEWKASGLPDHAQLVFSYRISHPRIVRPDGRVLTVTTDEVPLQVTKGEIAITDCYFLSEEHDLVAGEWEIAVWFQGQRLVAKRFNVGVAL
jgi:Domain of unknown function (DUF3859)